MQPRQGRGVECWWQEQGAVRVLPAAGARGAGAVAAAGMKTCGVGSVGGMREDVGAVAFAGGKGWGGRKMWVG